MFIRVQEHVPSEAEGWFPCFVPLMTKRALIIGVCLAIWVNLWPVFSSMLVRSARADFAHLSVAFLIPFIVILAINPLFGIRRLSPKELVVITCLGMVAANLQGEWLSGYFLGIISAPTYFANPTNRWAELILPELPTWSIVRDPYAARVFYEGLPPDTAIPWDAWFAPLASWGAFFLAILLFNFALSVIVRKQWVDHERLSFPVATVLTELAGVSEKGSLRDYSRSGLFWLGFTTIVLVFCWNFLNV